MKKTDWTRLAVAFAIAMLFVATGAAKLPVGSTIIRHSPVVVYGEPMLRPLIVTAKKSAMSARGVLERAAAGVPVKVSLTQYCLKGETRRGRFVRPGIVAADPRIFPLARYVEVYYADKYIGRYLVDDTGGNVKGATLDIWTPSCHQATRFGRHWGQAILVASDEEQIPHPAPIEINKIEDLTAIGSLLDGVAKRTPTP
jgi:3D (Asp-Asp-Asp) domain-containing protein